MKTVLNHNSCRMYVATNCIASQKNFHFSFPEAVQQWESYHNNFFMHCNSIGIMDICLSEAENKHFY